MRLARSRCSSGCAYGKPTIAAVGITRPDNSVESVSTEIEVRDLLIAGLGDFVAAGEGNPDRPIALADEGFCFRRFLGSARGEYFRPSRLGYEGDKACDDSTTGSPASANDWNSHGARWMSAACHRSLYGYQLAHRARARGGEPADGRHVPAARLQRRDDRERPVRLARRQRMPADRALRRHGAAADRAVAGCARAGAQASPGRMLDLVLLTVGANDIKFSGLVADVIISAGVERTLFNQGGQLATVPQAQSILDREFPNNFAKLRTALKPLVGGNLSRVVYVSYGHPAMQGDAPCPGGRDGLDVHPAFTADGPRLKNVTDFVLNRFLPRVKALARCEAGPQCANPDTDRMTFVDSHQAAFANHGICARSPNDPEFDRECFSPEGNSFESDLVASSSSPLVCSLRPSEFRPYAPRARWIRTANDSYFTAMTYPRGLSSTMQPSNIHDATWGAMSAVYGGAFHPSAEGHAAMADAALPAVRAALGLSAPPEVIAQPLKPLPTPDITRPQ